MKEKEDISKLLSLLTSKWTYSSVRAKGITHTHTLYTSLKSWVTLQTLSRLLQSRFLYQHAWVRKGLSPCEALQMIGFRRSLRLQLLMKTGLCSSSDSSLSFKGNTDDCTMDLLLLFRSEKQ